MKTTFLLLAAGFSLILADCVQEIETQQNVEDSEKTLKSFKYGNIEFALEMFRDLHFQSPNSSQNLFFSPLSVWSALTALYVGAKGETSKELGSVLGLRDVKKSQLLKALSVFQKFCDDCEQTSFKMANRIYLQNDVQLKLCEEQFGDLLKRIDFRNEPRESAYEINKWIEEQTNGKIQNLIPPSAISSLTQMVITNAVYFKEMWKNEFDPAVTQQREFYQSRDKAVLVDIMVTYDSFFYGVNDELKCQAIELPYADNELSMLILLPLHPFLGFDTLVDSLTQKRLQNLFNTMVYQNVLVSLPKFKVENDFELSGILKKMGLRNLFDPRFSDLSGFSGSKVLDVDAVFHKSYIKLNEEGTEAAAGTGVVIPRSSSISFKANHPFLYFIRHITSGTILFMGSIKSPQYE